MIEQMSLVHPLEILRERTLMRNSDPGSSPLLEDLAKVRKRRSWIPRLLQAPGDRQVRLRFWKLWNIWDRTASQSVALEDPVELLTISEAVPGGRIANLPKWKETSSQSPELELLGEGKRRTKGIPITNHTGRSLNTNTFSKCADGVVFRWPSLHAPSRALVALSVFVDNLQRDVHFEVREAFRPLRGFQTWLWDHPLRVHRDKNRNGWLTVFFPANLAPPEGTEMHILGDVLFFPRPIRPTIVEVKIAWKELPPSQSGKAMPLPE
jgi:hypothetical protein